MLKWLLSLGCFKQLCSRDLEVIDQSLVPASQNGIAAPPTADNLKATANLCQPVVPQSSASGQSAMPLESASTPAIETSEAQVAVVHSTGSSGQSPMTWNMSEYVQTLKNAVQLLAKKAEPFLDGTPFQFPISALNSLIDLASVVADNKSALKALCQEINDTIQIIDEALDRAKSQEAHKRACKLLQFLHEELAKLEGLLHRGTFQRVVQSDEDIKTIEAAVKRINGRLRNYEIAAISSIENSVVFIREESALQSLYNAAAPSASYDAGERASPPQCHPNTRKGLLAKLHEWSLQNDPGSQIFWLNGPAGAGKSAIAQTFCQDLAAKHRLGGSFFFQRGDPLRSNSMKLFPTIAHQLACLHKFKPAIVHQIDKDRSVFDKMLSSQFEKLIVQSSQTADAAHTLVIVIDGLDECAGEERQQEIVRSIAHYLKSPLPLRFLIVSRPEDHITKVFRESDVQKVYSGFFIEQSQEDIETFLRDKFAQILQDHEAMVGTRTPWPSETYFQHLVQKASGYFIYAATVIKFVQDPDDRPTDRLDIIMQIAEPNDKSPYSALDQLYTQILNAVPPPHTKLLRILSVFAANLTLTKHHIEQLLRLKPGDVSLTLRRLRSVIDIPPKDDWVFLSDELGVHHASFLDFLNDRNRSCNFYTGTGSVHGQNLAENILEALSYTNDDPSVNALGYVAWSESHREKKSKLRSRGLHLYTVCNYRPSIALFERLRRVNPDFLFQWIDAETQTEVMLYWLKGSEAPEDLIKVWEDYNFMIRCSQVWHCTLRWQKTKDTQELPDIEQVLAWTSPPLTRFLQAYSLVNRATLWHSLTSKLAALRHAMECSWDELRAIICPLRNLVGQEDTALESLFLSVAHRTRIHAFQPELDLRLLAQGAMQTMMKVTMHSLPWYYDPLPSWGCVLRSCPPDDSLLQTLLETEQLSALSAGTHHRSRENICNAIAWLKTFSQPPLDLIARLQMLVPESDSCSNDEWYAEWKEITGW